MNNLSDLDEFNRQGMFAVCSGYMDKSTDTYKHSDSEEIYKCCINHCTFPVKYCKEYCDINFGPNKEHESPELLLRCRTVCDKQRELCLDNCSKSSKFSIMKTNYDQCVHQFGCSNHDMEEQIDEKCIEKNKQDIFECCKDYCIPTNDIDCDQKCKLIEQTILDKSLTGKNIIPTLNLNEISRDYKRKNDITYIIIYTFLGICFGILLWFLLNKL